MAWEYLDGETFEVRSQKIANYLRDKTKGAVICDLNCGKAPVMNFLRQNYGLYFGNDILEPSLAIARNYGLPNTEFVNCPDTEVQNKLERIDILLALGVGAGAYTKEKLESSTEFESFKGLVEKFTPSWVIVEMIDAWEERFGLLTQYRRFLQVHGYSLFQEPSLDAKTTHWLFNRTLVCGEQTAIE